MKKAVFLTAYNRPHYLEDTLKSWKEVRGLIDWDIYVQIEPNDFAEEQAEMVRKAFHDHPNVEIVINPQVYGVLHNPWVGFERLFSAKNYDFVVRAEDDLVVSADILQWFDWVADTYKNDARIATAHAFTHDGGDPASVQLSTVFSPWVFGTWQDRWQGLIGPTWDHDYSTYNDFPGYQSGWDWNLNTRIFPQHKLRSAVPTGSRVHNIGYLGTHAQPHDYVTSDSFKSDFGKSLTYYEGDSS